MQRTELDNRLADLRGAVLATGQSVDVAIGRGMSALAKHDVELANAVIADDDCIDRACAAIAEKGACLITLQQPAVRDLRDVLAALAIADELERIGDHAEGIARLTARLPRTPDQATLLAMSALAALVRVQVQDALDAYRACNAARARTIWAGDAAVDTLYTRLVKSLMDTMGHGPDTVDTLETNTYLLWVAHNLERIADRAGNICERVVFVVTGERRMPTAS